MSLLKPKAIEETDQDKTLVLPDHNISIRAIQGRRPAMEDKFCVSADSLLFGVFDGHGGVQVADYLDKNIEPSFSSALGDINLQQLDGDGKTEAIKDCLKLTLELAEKTVLADTKFDMRGSTASLVYLQPMDTAEKGYLNYITANVGDSRIVLCRGDEAIALTVDHSTYSIREAQQVRNRGGYINWDYRVQVMGNLKRGGLAMTRAIGDSQYKPYVSAEPEIIVTAADKDQDRFIIAATDGFWDVFTNFAVVNYVTQIEQEIMKEMKNEKSEYSHEALLKIGDEAMAELLTHAAYGKTSHDNITVVFKWLKKGYSDRVEDRME